jgi:NAD(P)-dependent dehydrogenase (short-subunit alcohol dehydrogenase family)
MAGQFDGKVALVTGASAGIGRATALAFAEQGAKVVVADIAVEGGEETVRQINGVGGEAIFVKADMLQTSEIEALVRTTVETYGRLDYAHNNAGIEGALTTTVDYPEDIWNRVLAINLTSVWLCMKYEIPEMLKQGGGAIVNTASILGLVGYVTTPAYTASKHGVVGLTKVAAMEYATQGIRVNAVCPGWIETPMVMERGVTAGTNREVYQQLADMHPVKRLGKPEEIAQAVIWLCSDAASFVTGHAMAVDGGYTVQ